MSVLMGGIAGASSRMSGGLAGVGPMMVADVTPAAAQRVLPTFSPTQPVAAVLGRFRRHLTGFTWDLMNVPLGAMTVKWFDAGTDLLVGSLVSDTAGFYDVPIYVDGTYYAWYRKAGSPNVMGGSDIVSPV